MERAFDPRIEILNQVAGVLVKYNPFFNVFIDSSPNASSYRNYLHQIYLMARLAYQRPVRVLIADEIGLGKTVEAIRVFKHLKHVDDIKKVLILVPPILLDQWMKDLKNFGIRPIIVDRHNVIELYEKAQEGRLPSYIFIGSIEKLKLSSSDNVDVTRYPYFEFISSVDWDLVIVDEAHKLGYSSSSPSLRYERIGSQLCRNKAKNCLLLTATPHRGKTDDFLARIALLDRSFLSKPSELIKKVESLGLRTAIFELITDVIFFRRVKEDVNKIEGKQVFKPAHQYPVLIHVPEYIRELQLKILDFATLGLDRYYVDPKLSGVRELLRKLIIKRAMSSELALLNTFLKIGARRGGISEDDLERLRSKLENYITGEEDSEIELDKDIGEFIEAVSAFVEPHMTEKLRGEIESIVQEVRKIIDEGKSPKVNALADIIEIALGRGSEEHMEAFRDIIGGKIIVFTEFKDTAWQIFTQLQRVLEQRIGNVPLKYVRKANELQQEYIRSASRPEFSKYVRIVPTQSGELIGIALLTSESKQFLSTFQSMLNDNKLATAVLISTDVAAEGLNMQAANIVINYEVTWSPLKRDQRIGRVWRLGQKKEVYVFDFHMGTDFEKSILENFTVKIITIAEETGYTTVQYKGLAFYLPYAIAEEETEYALRVVEMERFNESTILENFAQALRRAIIPGGIDPEALGEEISRLALEIIRFTRQIRKELEILSKYRADPERVHREVKLLLGFGSEDEAREAMRNLVEALAGLGYVSIQDFGEIMYINKIKVSKTSLRDFIDVLSKLIETKLSEKTEPALFLVKDQTDFEATFLTFIIGETEESEDQITKKKVLYMEPILISISENKANVLRGVDFARKLKELILHSVSAGSDTVAFNVLKSKYVSAANMSARILNEIRSAVHSKPTKFIESYELSELRNNEKPKMIPDGRFPRIKFAETPLAIFIPAPYMTEPPEQTQVENKVSKKVPIVVPSRSVSPEKKEAIKTIAENLVKTYFESLGYKCVKRSEYAPYDFELYNDKGELVNYVEVKGHETDELIVELSENEEKFANENQDKYIVCIVTNALTNPRITCVSYKDLIRVKVYIEKSMKYIYRVNSV